MLPVDEKLVTSIKALDEANLRKIIRAFLAYYISDNNVQPYHGTGEHGVDTLAIVSKDNDPLGNGQILYIQVKTGDLTTAVWNNGIHAQMNEAYNSTVTPRFMSKDHSRRLLIMTNGECKPEVYDSVTNWNRNHMIPIEVFDVWSILRLFDKYNVKETDFEQLRKVAGQLGF